MSGNCPRMIHNAAPCKEIQWVQALEFGAPLGLLKGHNTPGRLSRHHSGHVHALSTVSGTPVSKQVLITFAATWLRRTSKQTNSEKINQTQRQTRMILKDC